MPETQRNDLHVAMLCLSCSALVCVVSSDVCVCARAQATPTVIRAMVVNLTQVATYDQFKLMLKKQAGMKDGPYDVLGCLRPLSIVFPVGASACLSVLFACFSPCVFCFSSGVGLHFSASFMAAFIYSFWSLPFDMAKVKMQNQKKGYVVRACVFGSLMSPCAPVRE